MFTGSTEVARLIQRALAKRVNPDGAPVPLVAETGGQNALIVDSSALPEQVVVDIIQSAFDSAGQRCSALRVLCLQDDVAERVLAMLRGALNEISVAPSDRLSTDVGPVITEGARAGIVRHIEEMRATGHAVDQVALSDACTHGIFVPPTLIEIRSISELKTEVFGPVLHVLSFRRRDIDRLIGESNATGYGLTFGVHSRIDETIDRATEAIHAGNIYVNRNLIGAVVGVQPFGGEGLSGTGPKAGGPLPLPLVAASGRGDPGQAATAGLSWARFLRGQGVAADRCGSSTRFAAWPYECPAWARGRAQHLHAVRQGPRAVPRDRRRACGPDRRGVVDRQRSARPESARRVPGLVAELRASVQAVPDDTLPDCDVVLVETMEQGRDLARRIAAREGAIVPHYSTRQVRPGSAGAGAVRASTLARRAATPPGIAVALG